MGDEYIKFTLKGGVMAKKLATPNIYIHLKSFIFVILPFLICQRKHTLGIAILIFILIVLNHT